MTKFLFLGTSALDFSPKLLTEYKDRFDLDARRDSCALLEGRYLIDCGPHALDSLRIAGVNREEITDIFITHFHPDHYNADNIETIAKAKKEPLNLWVSEGAEEIEIPNVRVCFMSKFKTCQVNGELQVTGLCANHKQSTYPQHLLFGIKGKKILYALDGGWVVNSTYDYLQNAGLDLLVLDATCGEQTGEYRIGEHNTIPMIRLLIPSFKTYGIVRADTKIYLSHLAPSLHEPHLKTVEIVKPDGLQVAYDGLEIMI